MSALDQCRAALERGVLRQVIRNGRTRGWRFGGKPANRCRRGKGAWRQGEPKTTGGRVFSTVTVRQLLREKFATRAGGTVRKRDGVTWRKRNGQA